MKKRVLWILNHETLSKFELPLLQELGVEIYTPKKVPIEILKASGSITYDYDHTLSIPKDAIKQLNEFNFYDHFEMPLNIKSILNQYFDLAFVMFDFYAINKVVNNFNGVILTRAFGLGKDNSYVDITKQVLGDNFLYRLEEIKDRYWFSQCYDNISDNESGIYKERSLFLPLGLPSEFYSIKNEWVGNREKLLFFCSRIKGYEESEKIYKEFKENFKTFDYIIAGNQPVPVNDSRVTGFLEREELNNLFKECKVMFYHSTYPRHVHYHPLEAMIAGMPVVYLEGGLLSTLGNERQAGRCTDVAEAKRKINRIMSGDEVLISKICEDQKSILYKFSHVFNKNKWIENFFPILESVNKLKDISTSKKIAIFVPTGVGQHIDDYIQFILTLNSHLEEVDPSSKLIINTPRELYDISEMLPVNEYNLDVRQYNFRTMLRSDVSETLELMFKKEPLWSDQYIIPVDHIQNNIDAEFWIFMEDKIEGVIGQVKRYGLYVQDIGDRFYSALSHDRIMNYKRASFLITNTEKTKHDLTKYLGISRDKVFVIPLKYPSHFNMNKFESSNYILIESDMKYPLSIDHILDSIIDFYKFQENGPKIYIHLNGPLTKENQELVNNLNAFIQKLPLLKNKVKVFANLKYSEYNTLIMNCKKIIIPYYVQNIIFKVRKAVYFAKPIVINELFNCDDPIYKYPTFKKFDYNHNKISNELFEIISLDSSRNELEAINSSYSQDVLKMWKELL
ncbi:putative glycosytransferase [Paenibacillus algicola]|uniref:Putative glycosytransferase n=1 Tax=Paenibacillus algicola TaxID=2565926 RepID=A0A4P8XNN6_9BACL|nr:hypothetical protein [Paenibacillus algicola]QCT04496.1 putative glycosytransferase [Paenibacillus algicola]